MVSLLSLFKTVKEDIFYHGGKTWSRAFLIIFFNMSFRLLLNYRIGHFLACRRNWLFNIIILWLKQRQLTRYSCDLSYHAKIGRKVSFPHPLCIVVGDKTVIHDKVSIWQQTTFGSHGKRNEAMSYPVVHRNVRIYTGATIIGGVTIGSNSIIAAHAIVNGDVPPNTIAVGSPAKFKPAKP